MIGPEFMTEQPVILSGVFVSRSEANTESKDPVLVDGVVAAARNSGDGLELWVESLDAEALIERG
jgi:hypothetical protein